MDFANKVVLITGASAGIGAASAVKYSKYGAKLALVGRNEENLKKVANECKNSKGVKPLTIVADISVVENLKRIVDETVDHFGGIDVLINNAAFVMPDSIRHINVEGIYQPQFDTNLRSVYVLTHHALPHLIKRKGNVVNVSSIASLLINASILSYSMTKAALDQFTKVVAFDLGPEGVRVNSVNPGLTKSSIWERIGVTPEEMDAMYKESVQHYPLGRIAESEDIADSILYLSSDLAKNITGVILVSDGGKVLDGADKNLGKDLK